MEKDRRGEMRREEEEEERRDGGMSRRKRRGGRGRERGVRIPVDVKFSYELLHGLHCPLNKVVQFFFYLSSALEMNTVHLQYLIKFKDSSRQNHYENKIK